MSDVIVTTMNDLPILWEWTRPAPGTPRPT